MRKEFSTVSRRATGAWTRKPRISAVGLQRGVLCWQTNPSPPLTARAKYGSILQSGYRWAVIQPTGRPRTQQTRTKDRTRGLGARM